MIRRVLIGIVLVDLAMFVYYMSCIRRVYGDWNEESVEFPNSIALIVRMGTIDNVDHCDHSMNLHVVRNGQRGATHSQRYVSDSCDSVDYRAVELSGSVYFYLDRSLLREDGREFRQIDLDGELQVQDANALLQMLDRPMFDETWLLMQLLRAGPGSRERALAFLHNKIVHSSQRSHYCQIRWLSAPASFQNTWWNP